MKISYRIWDFRQNFDRTKTFVFVVYDKVLRTNISNSFPISIVYEKSFNILLVVFVYKENITAFICTLVKSNVATDVW